VAGCLLASDGLEAQPLPITYPEEAN